MHSLCYISGISRSIYFSLENYLYCLHGYVYEKEERTWWLPIFTMLAEDKEDYVSVAYALGTYHKLTYDFKKHS